MNQYDIDLHGDVFFDFFKILKKLYSLIKTQKRIEEISTTDNKNDYISDLVD